MVKNEKISLFLASVLTVFVCDIHAAEDSHERRVWEMKQTCASKREAVVAEADSLDRSLTNFNFKSQSTIKARSTMDTMAKDTTAWRDLEARDTKRNASGVAKLKAYIQTAEQQLSQARQELAGFKEAEYQVWAREHPEEARSLELEKRIKSAQNAARDALYEAQEAKDAASRSASEAKRASQEAAMARQEAQDAQRRAERADQEAQDAVRRERRMITGW
ncbi:MAG: hypothetical protein HYV35_05930 [Lentisphaerae bacterium]|nr:hypothetical protein [Lentisphaerota bacterium]